MLLLKFHFLLLGLLCALTCHDLNEETACLLVGTTVQNGIFEFFLLLLLLSAVLTSFCYRIVSAFPGLASAEL